MQTIGKTISPNEISLYFHIPFCTRKCDYCHFYVLPDQENNKQQLMKGFQLEWSLLQPYLIDKKVITLYFGGGTPSLFGPTRIQLLIQLIRETCNLDPLAEITLEANPENITLGTMRAYAEAGINRVSIGIQSLDSHLLTLLGRLHSPQTALQSIWDVYQSGIHNISIDLMYDLPKQTLRDWEITLEQIQSLPITHLSLYNLTIEPHTIFFKKEFQLRPLLPDEETSLAMYEMAIEKLEAANFKQYEISAFCKPAYESQHNIGYWIGRPFLGLGPSAFSFWQGKRFQNIAHLGKYYTALKKQYSPVNFEEQLDSKAHRREMLVLQLRLRKGVFLTDFKQLYGPIDLPTQTILDQLIAQGYIQRKGERIVLTKRGILFYDLIASELI